ncbi:MAG TPA: NAD(P)/FAD-dependent oxidoreductase [Ignavibacteriales bacterium]|nr:NAD(P)/FAD-dependent oxidoreductase [Ignavibacteriales bacterium]
MKADFDLMIIGTGLAGEAAARRCSQAEWKVAITDELPYGGTCAQRGCDPKKVLVGAAYLVDWSRRMKGNGIVSESRIDWPELMNFKSTFTDPVPKHTIKTMESAGVKTYHGKAEFLDENTIKIGSDIVSAEHILLANGARPASLNIEGKEFLTYSDQFLSLKNLPGNITFVGGGYVSFEFAHIAVRAGAKVRIVHRGKRPLTRFDPDIVDILMESSKESGIEILLNSEVTAIEKKDGHLEVTIRQGRGENILSTEMVVHGAGRVPNLDGLMLEKGNVRSDKKGVIVNDYLQSVSNRKVYAAGDATQSNGYPLSPVATMEGDIAAQNLLEGNKIKPNYTGIPSVVFTTPTMASVGLTEKEAEDRGIKYKKNFADTSGWYNSKRIAEKHSAFKVLEDERTGRIIGAHLLGHNSEEVINIFASAIRFKIRTNELKEIPFSYPSHIYAIHYML